MSQLKMVRKAATQEQESESLVLFKRANTLWESGRSKKAFELFLEAASRGLGSAQHNVGYFYDVGLGVTKDVEKALAWYKKAWRTDKQTDTCINIAKVYGSEGNLRSARLWWRKAIDAENGDAALELAKLQLKKGERRNAALASSLLRKVKMSKHVTADAIKEAGKLLANR